MQIVFTLCISLCALAAWSHAVEEEIQQLHLAFSGSETAMTLDFVSLSHDEAIVQWMESLLSDDAASAKGALHNSKHVKSFLTQKNVGYLHTVEMDNLLPQHNYQYRIGYNEDADSGRKATWSKWIEFQAGSPKRVGSNRMGEGVISDSVEEGVAAVYADYGLKNDVSMKHVTRESLGRNKDIDYVLHIGDIAYNLFDNDSAVGNEFMQLVSNYSSRLPLMVAAGNHEHSDNFTEYVNRFQGTANGAGERSGSRTNFYYSFDTGLIHYIVINTEVYKFQDETANSPFPFTPDEQLEWLENDLIKANGNREAVPWIVMMGHKGWYMDEWGEVQHPDQIATNFTGFDYLGCKYGVDLYMTGHVHIYQRFLPVLGPDNLKFMQPPRDVDRACVSEDGHTYTNPKYMPTVVVASPGDQEITPRIVCPGLDVASKLFWDDSQIRCTAAYGYGHLQAVNHTHLYWEFVQTGKADNVTASDIFKALPPRWKKAFVEHSPGHHSGQGGEEVARALLKEATRRTQFVDAQELRERRNGDIIRDYMWIVQETHDGSERDYCE